MRLKMYDGEYNSNSKLLSFVPGKVVSEVSDQRERSEAEIGWRV
jgi:hypothetical protein